MVIDATFTMPCEGLHTPRKCLSRSVSVVLYRSHDKDWNVEEEMKGWELGERPWLPLTTCLMREDATPDDAAPLFPRCSLPFL